MFRSNLTDWCIKSALPFQRDPIKELAEACKKRRHHFSAFITRSWTGIIPHLGGQRRPWNDKAASRTSPTWTATTNYLKGQLKEISRPLRPDRPALVRWPMGRVLGPRSAGLTFTIVRSLQPAIIVNNRVQENRPPRSPSVFKDRYGGRLRPPPELSIPPTGFGPGFYWESCMTMNDHWGYNKNDQNWKSAQTLIRNLIDCFRQERKLSAECRADERKCVSGAQPGAAQANRRRMKVPTASRSTIRPPARSANCPGDVAPPGPMAKKPRFICTFGIGDFFIKFIHR